MFRNSIWILILFFITAQSYAENDSYSITAEQWAIPRHGERLLKMPALKQIISQWQKNTLQYVEISYPGGEQGELWLTELQDWLIALGLPSERIKKVVGSGGKDIIKLSVLSTGGKE